MTGGDPDTWLDFWRLQLGLEISEYLLMTKGEVYDLIACYQIAHGIAKPVKTATEKETQENSDREYIPVLK